MKSTKRILYARYIFIIGTALVTSLAILFIYETYQENSASRLANQANQIKQVLDEIAADLQDRESAFHRYLITLDSSAFSGTVPVENIRNMVVDMSSLTEDSRQQQVHVERINQFFDSLIAVHVSIAGKISDDQYFRSPTFTKALEQEAVTIDSIMNRISYIETIAAEIARKERSDAQGHTVLSTLLGVAGSIFSVVVFIIAFYFIDQELKRSTAYARSTELLNEKIAEMNTQLEAANANLQHLNKELGLKNAELEKNAKELSSFTHITSHDIQEPLRKIEFFISAIEERESAGLSANAQKYFNKVRDAVVLMRRLYDGMLDFSLTNITDNNIEELDLNEVLQLSLHSLGNHIQDAGAHIESGDLPRAGGIKYQLTQLFENIIANALKFRRPESTPRVCIRCDRALLYRGAEIGLSKELLYHRIDFEDNGIGFDPQYREEIFEIFQRLSKDSSDGIGIGLAICRRIATLHGGKLTAESNKSGSVFSLYLPQVNTSPK